MTRIAIIGAGPRGLSVLERLVASLRTPAHDAIRAAGLEIVLVDPHAPGPGQVWRRDQSPLVLMNTPAGSCTIFTDASVKIAGPIVPGPSLAQWSRTISPDLADLPDDIKRLAEAIADDSFAPRVLYGHYLHWAFAGIVRSAPSGVSIRHKRGAASDLRQKADGWHIALEDGSSLEAATAVILALGHPLARPSRPRQTGQGHHIRPGNATDTDLSVIGPGDSVALRGMGLCAFDYIALLTEGRGGRFEPGPSGHYDYVASGLEPRLILGSRRGLPFRGRGPQPAERYKPRVITPAVVDALALRPQLDFETDLLPLIAEELVAALGDDSLAVANLSGHPPDGLSLLERCSNPFGDRIFTDHAALTQAVLSHLRVDIADGQDIASPFRRLQGAMRLARSTIREQLSLRKVSSRTHGPVLDHIRDLLDFSISGPPAHRIAQLLALEAAGIVEFAGPAMTIVEGRAEFIVSSPRVDGYERRAQVLIDAWLPASDEPEPDGLVARQAQRGTFSLKSPLTGGAALAIDPESLAVLGPDGAPVGGCHALGQVIAPQEWVPVIAPLAGTNSRFLRMTDRAARAVLDGLPRHEPFAPSRKDDFQHAN